MQLCIEARSGDHCHKFNTGWVYGQSGCIGVMGGYKGVSGCIGGVKLNSIPRSKLDCEGEVGGGTSS